MDSIKRLKKLIIEYIYPVRCPYCGKVIHRKEYACEKCKELFPKTSYKRFAIGGHLCSAAFPYEGIFSKAVKTFKFHNCGFYAKQLSLPLIQSIIEIHPEINFDFITCVPMHKESLKKRGYNQAELLAKECAEIMNIPYLPTLEKFKKNEPQHSIKAHKRADNVKGVYRIIDKQIVANKNILIIDDIITTGHTLGECSKILYKSGCACVSCATVCTVVVH